VNVARPAAQKKQQARVVPAPQEHHTLLGTNENTTATPDEQSFLARQNYKDKSATAPVRQQAKTIEQAYVRGDDLKTHQEADPRRLQRDRAAGRGIRRRTSTPSGQRALGASPLGSRSVASTPLALKGIQALGLPDVESASR
jgi:hypothetical protein